MMMVPSPYIATDPVVKIPFSTLSVDYVGTIARRLKKSVAVIESVSGAPMAT